MNKLTKILAIATLIISMGLFPGCNSKPQETQKMQTQEQRGLTSSQQAMLEVFQQHMNAEMTGDIEATMATMTDTPYVNHVPVMTGGVGREGVRYFDIALKKWTQCYAHFLYSFSSYSAGLRYWSVA